MSAERPILFSGPLVRAILAGRKTETRRLVTRGTSDCGPSPGGFENFDITRAVRSANETGVPLHVPDRTPDATLCVWPRVDVGDTLWVREAWALHEMFDDLSIKKARAEDPDCIFYLADGDQAGAHTVPQRVEGTRRNHISGRCAASQRGRGRPSIHMPRWASRVDLRVKSVRVERLQDITGAGVLAEGVDNGSSNPTMGQRWENMQRMAFEQLWDSINGKRDCANWSANPWVWVIGFELARVRGSQP